MKTSNEVEFYELEKARFILKDACQLDVVYAYDDLVFSEYGLVIIQFVKDSTTALYCWFNAECSQNYQAALLESLQITVKLNEMTIEQKGTFTMIQTEENTGEFDIQFISAA